MEKAAIGFRVKSGWATVVLVAGPVTAPRVVDRRRVELADPAIPDSRQPYHAAFEPFEEASAKRVAQLVRVVEQFSARSVAEVIERYRADGHCLSGVAIVVGGGADPSTIKNDHIRAHASEGRLFREVVEEAARKGGLTPSVTLEKQLFAKASRAIRRPEDRLKAEVTALGKGLGRPWRGVEKAAALAAWMLLA